MHEKDEIALDTRVIKVVVGIYYGTVYVGYCGTVLNLVTPGN